MMIQKFIFIVSLILVCLQSSSLVFASEIFFDKFGVPSPELRNLLDASGVKVETNDGIKEIINKTKQWSILPPEQRYRERGKYSANQRGKILQSLDKMGFFKSNNPSKKDYDYVLVLGNLAPQFLVELRTLKHHVEKNNIKFRKLFVLGGNRPIDIEIERLFDKRFSQNPVLAYKEGWSKPGQKLNNEFDIVRWLYQVVPLPEVMSYENVQFVSASTEKRSTRQDTIKAWIEAVKPAPGSKILAVSFPPSPVFDKIAINSVLKNKVEVEVINCDLSEMVDPYFNSVTEETKSAYVSYLLDRMHYIISITAQLESFG